MNMSLEFTPLIPLPVLLILAGIGTVLVLLALASRSRGSVFRGLTLAVLVLALLNPAVRQEDREPLNDIAVVVFDRSQSQEIGERSQRTTAAEQHLREQIAGLANTEIRTATVRSGVTSTEDGTRLFAALKDALADVPPERFAGAVLVTDGQIHDVPKSAAELGYTGPIHTLITGDRNERDRRVILETSPRFGIVGQSQTIRFRIEETGTGDASAPVEVTVSVSGTVTERRLVTPGQSVDTTIDIAHGGQNLTEIRVKDLEGELTTHNNRAVVVTEGIRDRLRVLLISGEPHPGERTWRNLLKADASVDLVHFTILRPPEKQDGTPIKELSLIAFPTRELFVEKLSEFDLIIFDRYHRRGVLPMTYMANIADYVEKGGAVLVAAGPHYADPLSIYRTPLAAVLPAMPTGSITERPYRAAVTERGARHPVTRDLPGGTSQTPTWGRWFRLIDTDTRFGDTVMSGPQNRPLTVLARIREGRVAQLLSDHAWLWARGYEGGGPQAELLRRLAHWLMKEPELEEEALTARQSGSQLRIERRTMSDEVGNVTVTMPSGKTAEVELNKTKPGLWQGRLDVREAGIHKLEDGTLTSLAAVGSADPRETAEIHATGDKLVRIAAETGGAISWIAPTSASSRLELPRLAKVRPGRTMAGSGWLGLRATGAYRVRAIEQIPLFGTLLALALLLAALSAMWYREGR